MLCKKIWRDLMTLGRWGSLKEYNKCLWSVYDPQSQYDAQFFLCNNLQSLQLYDA